MCRLGRWIDFENDYKTMYPSFMETIWWVFNELYNKGLVYKGFKVSGINTCVWILEEVLADSKDSYQTLFNVMQSDQCFSCLHKNLRVSVIVYSQHI